MTESLQNAFSIVSDLSDTEQDAIAAWLKSEAEFHRRSFVGFCPWSAK
jgi:hypothetical protein